MGRNFRSAGPHLTAIALAWIWSCGPQASWESEFAKEGPDSAPPPAALQYVGQETCVPCHAESVKNWRSSHHDLAMAEASEQTVLGDFDDASFQQDGATTTFYRQGSRFKVQTDGPNGELASYEIAYTFGAQPLQQYLVAFPGGRYQALPIAWDRRPAADGGQRWFHLRGEEAIDAQNPLHWTGVYQNWNEQCAECHSTNLLKGYDPATETYQTTFSDIDVSCEACHGPGSAHVAWAQALTEGASTPDNQGQGPRFGLTIDLRDLSGGVWEIDSTTGIAARTAPRDSQTELETCARCHARRSAIVADDLPGRPLLDSHRLELLDEGLYHADGQILDEVFVYGSFLQSKMYRAGVSCGDCHDPHALEIVEPDLVCARCHLDAKFAQPSHHFHPIGSTGASCVACHMPARLYMQIDARRDHSFRVPRPDLSLAIGTPDACTECHVDRDVTWAVEAFEQWYGDVETRRPSFARAIDAGRRGLPEGRQRLAELAIDPKMPAIARGTALAMAQTRPELADLDTLRAGLEDSDALVRLGAVRGVEALDPQLWMELLVPRLDDPLRAVRIEAARVLNQIGTEATLQARQSSFELALAEHLDAEKLNAGRPDGQLSLGWTYAVQNRPDEAESAYLQALKLDPELAPAYVNLADLYREAGRDREGVDLLARALQRMPEDASLRHSLGLVLVRLGRRAEALEELARAAELAPDQTRYLYTYGVALHSGGEVDQGLQVLTEAHRQHPTDFELLLALTTLSREAGRIEAASGYARQLTKLRPEDSRVWQLVRDLEG